MDGQCTCKYTVDDIGSRSLLQRPARGPSVAAGVGTRFLHGRAPAEGRRRASPPPPPPPPQRRRAWASRWQRRRRQFGRAAVPRPQPRVGRFVPPASPRRTGRAVAARPPARPPLLLSARPPPRLGGGWPSLRRFVCSLSFFFSFSSSSVRSSFIGRVCVADVWRVSRRRYRRRCHRRDVSPLLPSPPLSPVPLSTLLCGAILPPRAPSSSGCRFFI